MIALELWDSASKELGCMGMCGCCRGACTCCNSYQVHCKLITRLRLDSTAQRQLASAGPRCAHQDYKHRQSSVPKNVLVTTVGALAHP
jgi:hypothetical protein